MDEFGSAFVTGDTFSDQTTFPETVGPFTTYNGSGDAFVAKVEADGTGLVYCGYIGGNESDRGWDIAVDGSGCAYVTGRTDSDQGTFPVTVGPDLSHNDGRDAFVAKVKADGSGLDYCGYIGGSGHELGQGIVVDGSGFAYVTGSTTSGNTTCPVIVGPDLSYNGKDDAFVAKVKPNPNDAISVNNFDYCGYIGGSDEDYSYGIAVDDSGNSYVTGFTRSDENTFPVTVGPDLTYQWDDAFVARVKPNPNDAIPVNNLHYCGYIGGFENIDEVYGIAADESGCAYVVGEAQSNETTHGFPVTVGPDLTHNGDSADYDAFVAKVCYTMPVGGLVEPVDRLQILAPWLCLAAFIVVAMAVVVLLKRRHLA